MTVGGIDLRLYMRGVYDDSGCGGGVCTRIYVEYPSYILIGEKKRTEI